MRLQVLQKAVLAVSAADAGLAPARMEALHAFEVFAVDVGLAELETVDGLHGQGNIARVDG